MVKSCVCDIISTGMQKLCLNGSIINSFYHWHYTSKWNTVGQKIFIEILAFTRICIYYMIRFVYLMLVNRDCYEPFQPLCTLFSKLLCSVVCYEELQEIVPYLWMSIAPYPWIPIVLYPWISCHLGCSYWITTVKWFVVVCGHYRSTVGQVSLWLWPWKLVICACNVFLFEFPSAGKWLHEKKMCWLVCRMVSSRSLGSSYISIFFLYTNNQW